jgi:hypothetical protein
MFFTYIFTIMLTWGFVWGMTTLIGGDPEAGFAASILVSVTAPFIVILVALMSAELISEYRDHRNKHGL